MYVYTHRYVRLVDELDRLVATGNFMGTRKSQGNTSANRSNSGAIRSKSSKKGVSASRSTIGYSGLSTAAFDVASTALLTTTTPTTNVSTIPTSGHDASKSLTNEHSRAAMDSSGEEDGLRALAALRKAAGLPSDTDNSDSDTSIDKNDRRIAIRKKSRGTSSRADLKGCGSNVVGDGSGVIVSEVAAGTAEAQELKLRVLELTSQMDATVKVFNSREANLRQEKEDALEALISTKSKVCLCTYLYIRIDYYMFV
jgi:hypothetical protein